MTKKSTSIDAEVITIGLSGKTVPEQLAIIAAAMSKLQSVKESSYKTNMQSAEFGDLKACTDIKQLIQSGSIILAKETAYNNFANALGLQTVPAFSVGGGSVNDWIQDIKLRIAVISEKDVREKLQKAHDKLSQFLTDAERRKQAEQEIADLVGGLNFDTSHLLGE